MSQAKNSDSTTPLATPAGSAASKPLREFGRRELLRGTAVAALAAGVAVVPLVGACGARGELAGLIRLYWQQVDYFNSASHISDRDADAFAASTYEATLHRIELVPVLTSEDAITAIEWVLREAKESGIDIGPEHDEYLYSRIATRLLTEARNFLAEEVRS